MKTKQMEEKKTNEKKESPNITVQLLNIDGDVTTYDDVKFITIVSKKYNLIIMKDYLPIIGEIDGTVEIGRENENVQLGELRGYFMHKHNKFNLFYRE